MPIERLDYSAAIVHAHGRDWGLLLCGFLSIYLTIDSMYVGIPGFQRGLFVLIVAVTLGVVLVTLQRAILSSQDTMFLFAVGAILIGGTLGVLQQSVLYPIYVVGDAASIALLALFLILGSAIPCGLFSRRVVSGLFLIAIVASVLSPLLGEENGRYQAPSPFAIGAAVGFAMTSYRQAFRIGALFVLGLFVVLAYGSGFRTYVALAVLGLFIPIGRALNPRAVFVLVLGLAIFASINVGSIGNYLAGQAVVSESRFRDLAAGEADQSIVERVLEVRDAWSTAADSWGMQEWVLGAGHGATYVPSESNIVRNITRDNRVHNIHVGPVLVLYRYGALGVLMLLLILIISVRRAWILFFSKDIRHGNDSVFVWILLMYLADFFVRNVMVDPMFAYSLAGFVFGRRAIPADR